MQRGRDLPQALRGARKLLGTLAGSFGDAGGPATPVPRTPAPKPSENAVFETVIKHSPTPGGQRAGWGCGRGTSRAFPSPWGYSAPVGGPQCLKEPQPTYGGGSVTEGTPTPHSEGTSAPEGTLTQDPGGGLTT